MISSTVNPPDSRYLFIISSLDSAAASTMLSSSPGQTPCVAEDWANHEMAYDPRLAQRVRDALRNQPDGGERKMFGGLAFMLGGHMLVGVQDATLMARIGASF